MNKNRRAEADYVVAKLKERFPSLNFEVVDFILGEDPKIEVRQVTVPTSLGRRRKVSVNRLNIAIQEFSLEYRISKVKAELDTKKEPDV